MHCSFNDYEVLRPWGSKAVLNHDAPSTMLQVGKRFWCWCVHCPLSLNKALCIFVLQLSTEHFPRTVVEHPGNLRQTWDMSQYFFRQQWLCIWLYVVFSQTLFLFSVFFSGSGHVNKYCVEFSGGLLLLSLFFSSPLSGLPISFIYLSFFIHFQTRYL